MPSPSKMMAIAAAASTASASAFQGFNYGATYADGTLKVEQDFLNMFKTAQSLDGTDGKFNSARLYTMLQGGTDNEPISAIPAAIKTKTSILFGLWASAGSDAFNKEIIGLQKTIDQYCDQLDGLVAGISVGSEDLYRDSPIGIEAGEFAGAGPQVLVKYINKVRETIKGTCLSNAPVGHVDTWTAYVNETNKPLIEACDWVGMDAYPYFENTKPNPIENAADLFNQALANTQGASGDKEVWITETGYPVIGKKSGDAVANAKNARTYWEDVGCPLFGKVNTWWYTIQDSNSDNPNDNTTPSFGVVGDELSSTPRYNLSCKGVSAKPETTSAASSSAETTSTKVAGDKEAVESSTSSVKSKISASATDAESDAEETATKLETASGMTTASAPQATTTGTDSTGTDSGSDSGSDSDNSAESGDSSNSGDSAESGDSSNSGDSAETGDSSNSGDSAETGTSPTPVPTDAGVQLKGSFGAVVVALALAFYAL